MALEPITRKEKIIAGQDLTPITRMEKFLKNFGCGGGGGGSVPTTGAVTTLHINVTAVNFETMVATFTADKTPAEMQQASVNGPIWCVVTFAAGIMSEEAKSFCVPPAWEYLDTVAFGSVTFPVHNKNGENDVTSAVSGTYSNNEWSINLRAFAAS